MIPILLALSVSMSNPLDQAEEVYLRTVLRRNLALRVDSLEREGLREAVVGAAAGLRPQVALAGDAAASRGEGDRSVEQLQGSVVARQWVPTGGTLEGALLGGTTRVDEAGRGRSIDTTGVQVSFTQPLLRGLGPGSEVAFAHRQAELAVQVKVQGSRAVLHARLLEARTAFWQQLARGQIVAARMEDSIRTARLLEAARTRLAIGAGSELDTLQAGAEHLKALSELLVARADERGGWRDIVGLSDTTGVELPLPRRGELPPLLDGPLPDSAALLAVALERSAELSQALALVEKARSESDQRGQARLPKLDATALVRNDLLDGGWVLGARARLEWDIPDGAGRSRYRQALLDLHAAGTRREAAKQELSRRIGALVESVAASRARLDMAIRLARAQTRRLAASEAGWNLGKVSWIELSASRRDALEAEAAAWQALAAAKMVEAELESRTGTGPERLGWSAS